MYQNRLKIFLLCLLSLVGMTAFAYDCEVNGIYYNLNESDHTASVTYKEKYQDNYSGNIIIPETFDYSNETYFVTSIGVTAFYSCRNMTSVKIPNGVTSIGDNAFSNCSGLTSITIPSSVTDISSVAFDGCYAIETITVAEGNSVYDSRDDCNAIIKTADNELVLGCKNTHIPNSVTSIGYCAFDGCFYLTSLEIPNSVKSIGDWAFAYCYRLTSVTIPSSVTSIGSYAFGSCSDLETIVVDEGNPNYDSRDNCNAIISKSDNGLIAGCKNSHIPDGVMSIHDKAFAGCDAPASLVIPNSVTFIGESAFWECRSLTRLTIGSGVTSIGDYAFGGCSGLTSIVSLIEELFAISNDVFSYGNENATLYVPLNTKDAYLSTNGWNSRFNDIVECLAIDETNFPDENFRNYLLGESYGRDGVITESELKTITTISINQDYTNSPNAIRSLKGIENFTALTFLSCFYNQLTSLDVSKNTELTFLDCGDNLLTSIDVSYNTKLGQLYCGNNQLTSLDVSNNTLLTYLHCYNNYIKGSEMDALIESLPDNDIQKEFSPVKYTYTEGNVCTEAQVEAAKAKGWNVTRYGEGTYKGSDEETITLSTNYNYSTFSTSIDLDFTDNTDVNVYTAIVNGKTVELTQIWKVPANTGVIIENISGNTYTTAAVAEEEPEEIKSNDLVAVTEKALNATELVADNAYILVDDYQFQKVTPNATGTLAIGKAYLRVPTTTNAASLVIGFGGDDGATGLTEKMAHDKDAPAAIYNLNGQRVTQPTKGLYIVNGKKVIIK